MLQQIFCGPLQDWHGRTLQGAYVLQVDELTNMAVPAKQR